ncbi:MAG: hypothetical protein V1901_03885 [Patescibacteria group bacterium]
MLACPNCNRNIVSLDFRRLNGCKYCIPKKYYDTNEVWDKEWDELLKGVTVDNICKCKKPKHQNWFSMNNKREICARCINYIKS